MQKQVVYTKSYERSNVVVTWIPQDRVLLYEMEGYIRDARVNEYIDDLLEAVRTYQPVGMIADPRKLEIVSPAFQQAIQSRFWPEIARLGVKRNPGITPEKTLANLSVARMVTTIGETLSLPNGLTLEIALLPSLDECLEWIRKA